MTMKPLRFGVLVMLAATNEPGQSYRCSRLLSRCCLLGLSDYAHSAKKPRDSPNDYGHLPMTAKGTRRAAIALALMGYGLAIINPGLGLIAALSAAVLYVMTMTRGN